MSAYLGTPSSHDMGCYATRRDRHCCLGDTWPSLDVWRWSEELLIASTSPYGPHCVITTTNNYKISYKISYFRYPLRTGNMRMCYKERHSLLLKCPIIFLRYMRMVRKVPDRLYNPHMVGRVSFLPKITLKFHTEYQVLGTLSALEMGWCAARINIHCCLGVL